MRALAKCGGWLAASLLALAILASSASATSLPPTITGNVTLKATESPFTGETTVEPGATLTVEPGVWIFPQEIVVDGTLSAIGTAEEPVVFVRGSTPGGWEGIRFEPGSGASVLDHAEVVNGSWTEQGMISVRDSSPKILHSRIVGSKYAGVAVHGGSPEIAYDHFAGNGESYSGVDTITFESTKEHPGEVNIHDNVIENGGGGIYVDQAVAPGGGGSLGRNQIENTWRDPVSYSGVAIPGDITENTTAGNGNTDAIIASGTVAKSADWAADGALLLTQELKIATGVTLTMDPGLTIIPTEVIVEGTLKAEGTAEKPIIFVRGSTPGSWEGIRFEPGSSASVLEHTEVANGSWTERGMISIKDSSPRIVYSNITGSRFAGIVVTGGSPEIAYNHFRGNGESYSGHSTLTFESSKAHPGEVNIHDNVVEGGGGGIEVMQEVALGDGGSLGNNTVEGTWRSGISYTGVAIPEDITENEISDSQEGDKIVASGTVAGSETWTGNGIPIRTQELEIPAGVTLTMEPGLLVIPTDIIVNGTLKAEGTAEEPIVFSSGTEPGAWNGIRFEPGSGASLLNYTEVAFGAFVEGSAAVEVRGSSPTIVNSTFRENQRAVKVLSGSPEVSLTRFRGNTHGILNEAPAAIDAQYDDWGCPNGPAPFGCGDDISGEVNWKPVAQLNELPRYCSGKASVALNEPCLLQKYAPFLRLDREENLRPDSAAEITDNWGDELEFHGTSSVGAYGNILKDDGRSGLEMGNANPTIQSARFPLNLKALGVTYPDEWSADDNDWIEEVGEDNIEAAHHLEEIGYEDYSYGALKTDPTGHQWLEYWYWYYYNGKSVADFGSHDGDWESVLIRLDGKDEPDEVLLSEHEHAALCLPAEMEFENGAPTIFVGLESHAGYPKAGNYSIFAGTDYADGEGVILRPPVTPIGTGAPSWVAWPGHWGDSKPHIEILGTSPEGTSPQGPAFHQAWGSPEEDEVNANECFSDLEEEGTSKSSMDLRSASLVGHFPRITYHVPGGKASGTWPRLRVTVDELGDGGIAPTSHMYHRVDESGTVIPPVELEPGHAAIVSGSIFYRDGRRVELAPKRVG